MAFDKGWRFAFYAGVFATAVSINSLASASTLYFSSLLNGAQESPPTPSLASGIGLFSLDTTTGDFNYQLAFFPSQLLGTQTGLDIETVGGTVLFNLLPLGSPSAGTIVGLTPTQENNLIAGNWYVNVATTGYPIGEIRGQIIGGSPQTLTTPEPSTWVMAAMALLGVGGYTWRKRRK